jgi:hypothetical protein
MDANRFDALTRSFTAAPSRRSLPGTLIGGAVALLLPGTNNAGARKRRGGRRRRRGRRKKNLASAAMCPAGEVACPNDPLERCCPADFPKCCPYIPGVGTPCCPAGALCCPGRPERGVYGACCGHGIGVGGCCSGPADCHEAELCSENGCCVRLCARPTQVCDNACCGDDAECVTTGTATRSAPGSARDVAVERVCLRRCPAGQERCGVFCCPPGEECGPDLRCRIRCEPDRHRCEDSDGGFSCCTDEQECCDGICCPDSEECGPDLRCRPKCDENERRCDAGSGGSNCCATSQNCCDGVCCPPGERCGDNLRCTRT